MNQIKLVAGTINHQKRLTSQSISYFKTTKFLLFSLVTLFGTHVMAGQVKVVNIDEQPNVSWKTFNDGTQMRTEPNRASRIASFGSEIPVDNNNDVNELGNGYDSVKEQSKGTSSIYVMSEDGVDAFVGNTMAHFSVGVDLSHQAILDKISGGASGDLRFSTVEVSGNVAIANESAADSYVGTYTLFARVTPEKRVMLPTSVSKGGIDAKDLVGTGVGLVPTGEFLGWQKALGNGRDLMEQVGDEFIHAIEYSSWLKVTLKFQYKNAEDKKNIGGQLSVNWAGGVDVNGSANFSSIDNAETVTVTVSAKQYGGDSQELVSIIPSGLLSCTLNHPTPCFDLFRNAVDYMKVDYPGQFQNADGSLNFNKFNPSRYFTARYDLTGPEWAQYMKDPYDELTFLSRKALREVHGRWERAMLDKRRAEYLLNERYSELSVAQESTVREIAHLSRDNITNLANLVKDCLAYEPKYCASAWETQTFFNSYDETALEF
ncbi:MAG: hypothetical protein KUG78_00005 [Kangiellaceae bacterium]|nr:hypothetical protein [Kangiellaceae bacterium]